ncbi:MAG: SIMPL domain-containing protein [Bacillota bacterium]
MLKTSFSKIIALGVLSMILLSAFMMGNISKIDVASAEKEANIISVQGEGKVKVKPDTAYITLGVETQNKDAKKAQSENAKKMSNIMASLKGLGIKEEDIQTTQYNIYPNHQYNPTTGKSYIDGYTVRNMVKVVVRDIEAAGTVIDAVAQNDSNIINNIQLGINDTSKYYLEALKKATENAEGKAKAMAEAVGVTISEPSKIVELGASSPVIYNYMDNAMAKREMLQDAASTEISAGMLEVTASVNVEYQY